MKFIKLIFCICIAVLFNIKCFANTPTWQNEKLDISVFSKKINNDKYNILIEFTLKNGWFISWDNPGDAGEPTGFTWNAPFKRINETVPQITIYEDIIGQYGYSNKAYYLFEGYTDNTHLNLVINWEACKNECKKENAKIELSLSKTNDYLFDKMLSLAKKTFPSQHKITAKANIIYNKDNAFLNINIDNPQNLSKDNLYFIPYQQSIIYPAEKQKTTNSNNKLTLSVPLENPIIPTQGGLLIDNDKAHRLTLVPLVENVSLSKLVYIIILAFLGGIILNFMPCVFPVLSIKAMSISNKQNNWRHAFLYLSGVISSFLILALLLFLLRKTGNTIGWGFQLQSTTFVFLMLLIFIVLLLMIFDIISISPKLLNWFNKMGNLNSFMAGFFAVLIASPCTGPFLGAALGYTLLQSPSIYFIIFFSLGLGYGLPFTLLELQPKIISKIMPKSGTWMKRIKYFLSIPIIFTCLWLLVVLVNQIDKKPSNSMTDFNDYDKVQIRELINAQKPVFIEFTAKWCLTCLLNEKLVLNTKDFSQLAKTNNISLFRADWTKNNEQIGEAIKSYGRNSVPLYIYYPPRNQNYIILPQILTLEIIKSVFSNQNKNQN